LAFVGTLDARVEPAHGALHRAAERVEASGYESLGDGVAAWLCRAAQDNGSRRIVRHDARLGETPGEHASLPEPPLHTARVAISHRKRDEGERRQDLIWPEPCPQRTVCWRSADRLQLTAR
jgi:hypothetical protein